MLDYDVTLDFLLDCARGAGQIVMRSFGHARDVRDKGPLDLVTQADYDSEQYLIQRIGERFPEHAAHGFSCHPFKLDTLRPRYQAILDRLGPRTQHLINLGSQALVLAYVAAGRLDGMLAIPLDPWSSPAATLLIREAGGTTEPAPGGPWLHPTGALLATNGR